MNYESLRQAPFALRVVERASGPAAIIYRRVTAGGRPGRLAALGSIAPLSFTAAQPLLRMAVGQCASAKKAPVLKPGPYIPLDADWGARVACYALISSGLRDGGRLARAAEAFRHASGPEAAWWLGRMQDDRDARALRALRILTEATA